MSLLDLVNERKESLDIRQSRRESEADEDSKAQVRAQVSGSDYNPSGSSTLSLDHSTSVFGTDGAQIIPCVLGLSLAFQTYTGKCRDRSASRRRASTQRGRPSGVQST